MREEARGRAGTARATHQRNFIAGSSSVRHNGMIDVFQCALTTDPLTDSDEDMDCPGDTDSHRGGGPPEWTTSTAVSIRPLLFSPCDLQNSTLSTLQISNVTPMDQEMRTIQHDISSLWMASKPTATNHTHRQGHSYGSGGLTPMELEVSTWS